MSEQERPPIFKSWNYWYWIVLAVMLLQVVLYYTLTRAFQ